MGSKMPTPKHYPAITMMSSQEEQSLLVGFDETVMVCEVTNDALAPPTEILNDSRS